MLDVLYLTGQGQAAFKDVCWNLVDEFQAYEPPLCKENGWEVCNVVAKKVLGYFSGWNWNKNDGEWQFASEKCIRFIAVPDPDSECGYEYIPIVDPNDDDFANIDECTGGDYPEPDDLKKLCEFNIGELPYPPE